ncbi:hypothetical protein C8R47DRAFT_1069270 [Mycena vitilis]|nr:hypothetical protein C8R47DRAFT_1069270 [Mycena vitilis]
MSSRMARKSSCSYLARPLELDPSSKTVVWSFGAALAPIDPAPAHQPLQLFRAPFQLVGVQLPLRYTKSTRLGCPSHRSQISEPFSALSPVTGAAIPESTVFIPLSNPATSNSSLASNRPVPSLRHLYAHYESPGVVRHQWPSDQVKINVIEAATANPFTSIVLLRVARMALGLLEDSDTPTLSCHRLKHAAAYACQREAPAAETGSLDTLQVRQARIQSQSGRCLWNQGFMELVALGGSNHLALICRLGRDVLSADRALPIEELASRLRDWAALESHHAQDTLLSSPPWAEGPTTTVQLDCAGKDSSEVPGSSCQMHNFTCWDRIRVQRQGLLLDLTVNFAYFTKDPPSRSHGPSSSRCFAFAGPVPSRQSSNSGLGDNSSDPFVSRAGQDHGRDLGLGHPQDALGNCDNFCAVAVWTPMKAADTLSDINTHSDKTSRTPYFLHNCECGLGRGVTAPEVEPGLVKSSNFLTPRGREYSAPRSLKKTPENMFTFVFKLAAAVTAAAKKFNKVVTRGSTQAAFATPTQVSVVPSGAPPTYREVYHTHSDDVDSLPSYVEAAHDDVNDYTETPAYESFRTSQREKQYHQDGEETSDRLAQIVSTKRMYTSSPESTRIHISIGVTKRSHGFIQATQRHASSTLTFNRAEIARDWIARPQRCAPSYAGFRLPDDARLYPRLTDRHPPLPPLPPHTAISPSLQLPPSPLPTPSPLSTPSPLAPNTLVYPDKPASPVLSHKTSARIHSRAPSFSVLVGARSTNARAPSCIAPLVHAQSPDQHTLSSQDRLAPRGRHDHTSCMQCAQRRAPRDMEVASQYTPSAHRHGEAPEANHLKIRIRFLPLSLPATLPARERRGLHAHRAPRPVASPHPAPTSSGRMSDIRRICWRTNPSDRTANDEADEVGATPQIRDPSFCSLRKQTRSSRARLPARARYICDRKPGAAQKTRRRTAPVAQPEAQVARPVRIAAGPRARTLRHSRASQPLPTLTGRAARRAARAVQVGARRWATTVSVPRGACTVHLVCAARSADLAADLSTHARKSPVRIAAVQPHGHVATMTCVRLAAVSAIRARGGRRAPSQQARSEGAQRAPSGHPAGTRRALGGRSAGARRALGGR